MMDTVVEALKMFREMDGIKLAKVYTEKVIISNKT